jgi:hypothetical protein
MDDPKNRYLPAELFCWVMTVQRVETVILVPRRDWVIQDLIDTYSVDQDPRDIHVAIGTVSNQPVPPQCNQLQLPVVAVDQVYHSGRKDFLESIPVPSGADPDRFRDAAGQVFDQVLSQSDNAGFKDEDRVKNWALIKFGALYAAAAKAFADNCSFHSLEVLPSALGLGTRSIYDVVAGFRSRESGVLQKQYATVDASEVRPVLVSGFRPWVETRSWT